MGYKIGKTIQSKITTNNKLVQEFIAELLGTFLLLGVGLGANMMYVLHPRLNTFLTLQLAWGFTVALAVWTCFAVSGGQINPAVTLAMAVVGRLKWIKVPVYWLAQYLGAFFGAAFVYLVYYDALNHFDGGHRTVVGVNATAGIFATFPQPYLSTLGGFVDQVCGTMLLLLFIMALTDRHNTAAPSPNFAPICFGVVVTVIGMTFGMNCGYPINPARDLSPRIFTAVAGWGFEVFTACNVWSWVPVVAPHVGGVLGAWIYIAAIGAHLRHREQPVDVDSKQHEQLEDIECK